MLSPLVQVSLRLQAQALQMQPLRVQPLTPLSERRPLKAQPAWEPLAGEARPGQVPDWRARRSRVPAQTSQFRFFRYLKSSSTLQPEDQRPMGATISCS